METDDKTFKTPYGLFTLNARTNAKIASLFEQSGHNSVEEIELLKRYITKDSVVFDVGAHVGSIAIPLAQVASKVHAFEPFAENISYLHKNIAQNNISNIIVHETALGNKVGTVGLVQRHAGNTGGGTVEGQGDIPLTTLDATHVGKVDLIKVDVEGYEPQVFEGAKDTIVEYQPIIFFEVNLPELRRHGKHPLMRIEKALRGYKFSVNGKSLPWLWVACLLHEPKFFLFGRGSGTTFNVLAQSKD